MATNSDNNLPAPQSYEQFVGDMLAAYAAKIGVSDPNVGSAVTSFFEVVALVAARSSGDIFQILRDFSVDRATGDALQRLAVENGVTPTVATPTTGNVTIIDTSFVKIATAIYAGAMPPNIGSLVINVSDASDFPATGAVYLGRGTPNIEGPISYVVPPVQVGNYWQITLSTPTVKYHNLGETVILAQGGNRSIASGTMVVSPAVGATTDIQYGVVTTATILDGETTVTNVAVTAVLPGSTGNVPSNSITEFPALPFPGATVTNPSAFTSGTDTQTDAQLRVAIKAQLASIGLGTATAIQNAVEGATSATSSSSIVSASVVQQTNGSAILYIDNGQGYEAQWQGVGLETIVSDAIGGEQYFQLATGGSQAPVAKAFLVSTQASPFSLVGGNVLAVNVGGVITQHTFQTKDFVNPGSATAYEVTASINGDSTLNFEAATSGDGTYVVIRAIAEVNDSIQIATPSVGIGNAGLLMGFPSTLSETLRLYKNNIPLTKDGQTADIFSQAQSLWSNTIQNGDTLILQVDGTAPITYTVLDSDFASLPNADYTTVASTNNLSSWQQVLQNKLTGVTVSISGDQIEIVSNLEANNRAQLLINPTSTLVIKGMFSSSIGLSAVGKSSDFTLSRNTAQFELVVPLVAGDSLNAGSTQTAAMITSAPVPGSAINFPAEAYFWVLADAPGQVIMTGVTANSYLSVSLPAPNIIRYTSSSLAAFSGVLPGDYIIIWSTELNAANRIEGRVHANTATTLDIAVTDAEYAAAVVQTNVIFQNGFVVLRSLRVPRKFSLPSGLSSLDQISAILQAQTDQLAFSVQKEQNLVIRTNTIDPTGSLMVVTADANAALIGFTLGNLVMSQTSLLAYVISNSYDGQLPLFVQNQFAADSLAYPPDSYISAVTSAVSLSNFDPTVLLGFLNPYGGIDDEQPSREYDQVASISGAVATLAPQGLVRRVRGDSAVIQDRFFVASPLDFGNNDTFTVITDNNPTTNSFTVPLYRIAVANNTQAINPNNFNAFDSGAGPTAQFYTNFLTPNFFANYKALMQAKKVLNTQVAQTAILYRATQWGRGGQYITVSYQYPTAPNSTLGSTITVNELINIAISLQSGAARVTSIDNTTQWTTSIVPNTPPGVDQVTYTWTGGTAPGLILAGIIPGDYVNINNQTSFNAANIGAFRVMAVNATSFTVQRPNGVAIVQSGVLTNALGAITFYASTPTTANQIVTYVNANLVDITAVNSSVSSGTGVITYSTYEDTNFTTPYAQLQDGINWITSSNLVNPVVNPQFSFTVPLAYDYDANGYQFNINAYGATSSGEMVTLVPTTMDQVSQLLNVLAVTGFTTLGNIDVVQRGSKLELSSITLGSQGDVQVVSGWANGYSVPVLNSGALIDNNLMSIAASNIASAGIHSDQWFRLQAAQPQIKDTLFGGNTDISIFSNDPQNLESLVELSNRTLTQRNFGIPRNYIRTEGDTFRIEQQGNLACLSWTGVGTNPMFSTALNFNDTGGGTYNAVLVPGSDDVQFTILSGVANFTQLSIGDYITINLTNPINNGTFLVTGVSEDGTVVEVLNSSATSVFSSGSFTFTGNLTGGEQFVIGATTLTAGTFATITDTVDSPNIVFTANNTGTAGNSISLVFDGVSTVATIVGNWNTANPLNTVSYTGLGTVIPAANTWTLSGGTNGNFAIGTTTNITAANLSAAIAAIPTVTSSVVANVVTITGTVVAQTVVLSTTSGSVTVTAFAGSAFTAGQFTANSAVSEGDTVIISSPFNVLNQGQFRVIRQSNNSIWYENPDTYEEEVSLPFNPISLGFDTTTQFEISTVNNHEYLTWTGVGTPPTLENVNMGDIITFGTETFAFVVDTSITPHITFTANFAGPAGNSISLVFNGVHNVAFVVGAWNTANPGNTVSYTGLGTAIPAAHTWNLSGGSNVTAGYQGSFMVVASGGPLQEITEILTPPASVLPTTGANTYFTIYSAGDTAKYYVWFAVIGASNFNTDPLPGGYTAGLKVPVASTANSVQVAMALTTALNGYAGAFAATSSGNTVMVSTTGFKATTPSANVNVPLPFFIEEYQAGTATFLEVINPASSGLSPFTFININLLTVHRPQLEFFEYEATIPGDNFVVTGNILGASNIGSWPIKQVLSRNSAIVTGTMAGVTAASLSGVQNSVYVQEGVSYTGYKQVKFINSLPGSTTQNIITFNTNAQYEKIDQAAGVEMVALNKLGFPTSLISGLDSYSYNTDLIELASKIVYGDPTQPGTYPGVSAAGAEIFIQEPLSLRVTMAIDVRLQTGVPFPYMVQQIQSTVGALVNSNKVGQSISLSSIVSAVQAIPGVISVVITSPLYDAESDLIVVAPSEKTLIINPTTDIAVAQLGT